MNRMFSFIAAVFVTAAAFAQMPQQAGQQLTREEISLQAGNSVFNFLKQQEKQMKAEATGAKAETRAGEELSFDIISNEPEGKKQDFLRAGKSAYFNWMVGNTVDNSDGYIDARVSEDGMTVYFYDVIKNLPCYSWVKATYSDDKKTLVMPMGQCVSFSSWSNSGTHIMWCSIKLGPDGKTIIERSYDPDVKEAIFDVDDEGVLTLRGCVGETDENGNTVYWGLGGVYSDTKGTTSAMDFCCVYTPTVRPENIPAPENLEVHDYVLMSNDYYYNQRSGKKVKAGWDGDDFWIQGFDNYFPEAWAKGTLKDGKVVFEIPQFIGFYSYMTINLVGGKRNPELAFPWDIDELVFDYDPETKSLKMDMDHAMVTSSTLDQITYLTMLIGPEIIPYEDKPVVPATPYFTAYTLNNLVLDGSAYFSLSVPTVGANGEFMDTNLLSYQVYFDGEPYTFTPNLEEGIYPKLSEPISEIPYNYTDGNYDIYPQGQYVFMYETAFKTVGVKSIYRGGGEVRESELIMYYTGLGDANEFEGTNVYRSFDGDEETLGNIGTGRKEVYDLATYVQDANLVGAKVKGMHIYTSGVAKKANIKGWVAKKLDLKKVDGVKVAKTDVEAAGIADGETTGEGMDIVSVTFDKPYEITADGFFAGYSFEATALDLEAVALSAEAADHGFFIRTGRSYNNWVERGSAYNNAMLPVVLEFEDGTVKALSARFIGTGEHYTKTNEPKTIKVIVANNGTTDIESIDYTVQVAENSVQKQLTFSTPITGATYGQQTTIDVEVPAIAEAGSYPLVLTIDKVNGADNLAQVTTDEGKVNAVSFFPKHRALVEEYTGTWCGWCPRGLVGMSMLAEEYAEDFVGVAYHNKDPMAAAQTFDGAYYYYPNAIGGFPGAFINRVPTQVDPYYGTVDGSYFGIKNDVDAAMAPFACADISVKGEYDSSNNTVKATANTTFVTDGNNYAIEFIVIENDVTGEGGEWVQNNYFPYYNYDHDPALQPLTQADAAMSGVHFNDVFLASSGFGGIKGSLPEKVAADGEYSSEYTFNVNEMVNIYGDVMVQNVANLEVVALLINCANGTVANAAKAKVEHDITGVQNIQSPELNAPQFYNLAGQKVQPGYKGFVVTNGRLFISK